MEFNPMTLLLVIFTINVVYVTLFTIRMILTMKGYKYVAAGIAMVEVLINIVGLGLVLDNLGNVQNLIAYAVGFGTGIIVGSKIEDKLALGYITVNVITDNKDESLAKQLRQLGYGVTDWEASGLDGDRRTMQILTPRKYELKLYKTIKELDSKAFIISYEPKTIHGGFWVKTVRKGKLFK